MEHIKCIGVVVTMTLFVVVGQLCQAHAAGEQWEINSLRGLKEIVVSVAGLKPNVRRWGLTEERIRTLVEFKLQQAEIYVARKERPSQSSGILHVDIQEHVDPKVSDLHVLALNVRLVQSVRLARNPVVLVWGETWSHAPGVCLFASRELWPETEKVIARYVDAFINDYLTANPKW